MPPSPDVITLEFWKLNDPATPHAAGAPPVPLRTVRVRRVFDQDQAALGRQRHQTVHVGQRPAEVHHEYRFRLR